MLDDLQRVDLLISLHHRDLRRVGAAGTASHDDRRHDRCHLPDDSDADEIGNVAAGAEALQLDRADKREDGADQAVDHGDDADGADASVVHLRHHVAEPRA